MRSPLVLCFALLLVPPGCGADDGPEEFFVGDTNASGDGDGDGAGDSDLDMTGADPVGDGQPSDGVPGDVDLGDFDAGDLDLGDFDLGDGGFGDFDLGDSGDYCVWLVEQCTGGQSWACSAAEAAGCMVTPAD